MEESMTPADSQDNQERKWIEIEFNGPYIVHGRIPLVRKTQVVSEYGEPLTWKKEETIPTDETYHLCRCGHSKDKPFCDCTHLEIDFDGTENADSSTTAERQVVLPSGKKLIVRRDFSLCMESGFCGNRVTNIEQMVPQSDDTQIRAQIIAMIERCPSGSFTFALQPGEADIEPDLPEQIAITTDITENGPVEGALWITGNIPVERSDGRPLEIRNRVTLCRCGLSKIKPLCDGAHRYEQDSK
jgi:CDGSH-type Zn-finger protein